MGKRKKKETVSIIESIRFSGGFPYWKGICFHLAFFCYIIAIINIFGKLKVVGYVCEFKLSEP